MGRLRRPSLRGMRRRRIPSLRGIAARSFAAPRDALRRPCLIAAGDPPSFRRRRATGRSFASFGTDRSAMAGRVRLGPPSIGSTGPLRGPCPRDVFAVLPPGASPRTGLRRLCPRRGLAPSRVDGFVSTFHRRPARRFPRDADGSRRIARRLAGGKGAAFGGSPFGAAGGAVPRWRPCGGPPPSRRDLPRQAAGGDDSEGRVIRAEGGFQGGAVSHDVVLAGARCTSVQVLGDLGPPPGLDPTGRHHGHVGDEARDGPLQGRVAATRAVPDDLRRGRRRNGPRRGRASFNRARCRGRLKGLPGAFRACFGGAGHPTPRTRPRGPIAAGAPTG